MRSLLYPEAINNSFIMMFTKPEDGSISLKFQRLAKYRFLKKQSDLLLNVVDLDAMWVCLRENYVIMMTPLVQGRSEMGMLISLLSDQSSSRRFRLLNLLMSLLPTTLSASENAAEYFELLFKMIETEDARLFLTVRECLTTICKLITQEVSNVESLERSLFMREQLLFEVLEALIVIRGLIVQKTKLIKPSLTTSDALEKYRVLSEELESLIAREATEAEIQVFKGLYENASNTGHVGAHLAMLAAIHDVSKLVFKELTSWACITGLTSYPEDVNVPLKLILY
ncbi:hypothetical protein Tco_0588161 [Tanacetum coccineum]